MEALLILLAGIGIGILMTNLWYSMRNYWRKGKDLRAASAKARKAVQEQSAAARQNSQKANDAVFRAGLRVFFLVVAIIVSSWLIWTIILI
jgi:hypothetical protein